MSLVSVDGVHSGRASTYNSIASSGQSRIRTTSTLYCQTAPRSPRRAIPSVRNCPVMFERREGKWDRICDRIHQCCTENVGSAKHDHLLPFLAHHTVRRATMSARYGAKSKSVAFENRQNECSNAITEKRNVAVRTYAPILSAILQYSNSVQSKSEKRRIGWLSEKRRIGWLPMSARIEHRPVRRLGVKYV